MEDVVTAVKSFVRDDRGNDLVDYAFMAGLLALAASSHGALTDGLRGLFTRAIAPRSTECLP